MGVNPIEFSMPGTAMSQWSQDGWDRSLLHSWRPEGKDLLVSWFSVFQEILHEMRVWWRWQDVFAQGHHSDWDSKIFNYLKYEAGCAAAPATSSRKALVSPCS
jgi:hypothetical protein